MISQIASVFIIGAAVILIHDDPLHKFHHVAQVKMVKVASVQQPTDAQVAFAARYMRMLPAGKGVK